MTLCNMIAYSITVQRTSVDSEVQNASTAAASLIPPLDGRTSSPLPTWREETLSWDSLLLASHLRRPLLLLPSLLPPLLPAPAPSVAAAARQHHQWRRPWRVRPPSPWCRLRLESQVWDPWTWLCKACWAVSWGIAGQYIGAAVCLCTHSGFHTGSFDMKPTTLPSRSLYWFRLRSASTTDRGVQADIGAVVFASGIDEHNCTQTIYQVPTHAWVSCCCSQRLRGSNNVDRCSSMRAEQPRHEQCRGIGKAQ